MRLCIVSREYPPITSYTGGIGTTFAAIAPALARQGHDVHVVTITTERTRRERAEGVEVSILRRPNPEHLWFLEDVLWTVPVTDRLRRLGRFDAVFAAEWGGDLALYSRRKRRGPLATHLTTSIVQAIRISPGWSRSRRQRARHAMQHRLERAQTERSDLLIASSRAILDWTRELWDIDDIPSIVLPNGVDVARVRGAAEGPLPDGFPQDGPIVAFCGRLEGRKGVQVLVPAMHEAWRRFPSARLVLMGRDGDWEGGRMSDHLRALAGPYADRLHMLGVQPSARLHAGLRAADVVALPSLWENFALAAVETLVLGKPLIATRGSGYDDFIEDERNGLLVPPEDEESLAAAITRLLEDDALRGRLGTAAAATGDGLDSGLVAGRFADALGTLAR